MRRTHLRPLLATAPLAVAFTLALAALAPRAAHAADVVLDRLAPGTVKLDGKLYEWPGTTPASESVQGSGPTTTFYAGYDDQGIWVGAEVAKSGGVGRTSSFGTSEDCVSLVIAFPKTGVWKGQPPLVAYEVGFYAGVPGSSTGAVKLRGGANAGKTLDGAKLAEASRKGGGYYVEGFVPWSAFPEAKVTRAGLRGALRVYDGDGKQLRGVRATSAGSVDAPERLGHLLTVSEQALPADLATRKLSLRDAAYEIVADLNGDSTNEHALLFGHTMFVFGPTFKEGKQYVALDVGADVIGLESRDVTGDGKADLLFTTRVKMAPTTREALAVWMMSGEKLSRVFTHETAVLGASGEELRDHVAFATVKGKATATITYDAPKVWSVATYREPIASDVDPILWPWATVKERTFVFSTATLSFAKDRETSQTPTAAPAAAATSATAKPLATTVVPTPKIPPPDASAVFAQYRKDRGVGADVGARFVADVTVVTGRKGRVALYGRDLVVALGGDNAGYAFAQMTRFATDKDILEVSVRDATGDGRDEIFVRGIVGAKLTGPGGDKEVIREVVSVYTPKQAGSSVQLVSVLTVEVARAIAGDRVDAALRVGAAKGTIELGRGTAKGWTQKSYPFGAESPTPGLEPLLLPWASDSVVVYKWNGEKFAR
jgi:hypothetical protein